MPEIFRADDRFLTEIDGTSTRHSFSYGRHYSPDNTGFGPLIAVNVETIDPGHGYGQHFHADVDIVTWVISGALAHEDTTGHRGVIRPGTVQRLSAGTGVQHAERNASNTEPLIFVQMMLSSTHEGEPEYASEDLVPGPWTPTLRVAAPADLFVASLRTDEAVTVPQAARSLIHVTRGSMVLKIDGLETPLKVGDEARMSSESAYSLRAIKPAEALVWQLHKVN